MRPRCEFAPGTSFVAQQGAAIVAFEDPLAQHLARLRRLTSLGGAQFAFLAFLMGHSLEGFGQWKALLALALGCEAAPLGPRAPFYRRLLAALTAQLALCLGPEPGSGSGPGCGVPGPLGLPLAEELLADSFLRRLFWRFFEAVREGGARAAPIQVHARHVRCCVGTPAFPPGPWAADGVVKVLSACMSPFIIAWQWVACGMDF